MKSRGDWFPTDGHRIRRLHFGKVTANIICDAPFMLVVNGRLHAIGIGKTSLHLDPTTAAG